MQTELLEPKKTETIPIPSREAVDFLWYAENRLTTEKGHPLDFMTRPYLQGIYDCTAREIVFKKSSQVGVSQYAVSRVIHLSDNFDITSIYILPTRSAVGEFSQARFNPIASHSRLRSQMEVDNVHVKHIGNSFIYFRGTKGETEALSVPADILVIDEKDRCQPDTVESYNERLSASPLKMKIQLSTPTVPDYGIDLDWKKSDQREWFVICPKCEFKQVLTEHHIDYESNSFRCEKPNCKAELDRNQGHWIATADSLITGFHPTQLICPWISAREILDKKEKYEFPADYYNFVLGETYAGGTEIVTRADVLACIMPNLSMSGPRSMGVDWGDETWFVVRCHGLPADEAGRIIHYGKITGDTRTHAKQVLEMADKLKVNKIFMDFGYGDTKNMEVIDHRPRGTAWMVIYTHDGKDLYPKFYEKDFKVNIDRTRSLQLRMMAMKEGKTQISANNDCQEDLIQHYTSLFEKKEKDNHGTLKVSIENKGSDHLAHADNYASIPEIAQNQVEPDIILI